MESLRPTPQIPTFESEAALGLGLCESSTLLTPEELQQLNEDLEAIAKTQKQFPEHWDTSKI